MTDSLVFDDRHLQLEKQEKELERKLKITRKQRKAEKKQKKKLPKTIVDVMPLRYLKSENCIVLRDGVTDYLQITGIKIDDLTPNDQVYAIQQFHHFLKQYDDSFKLIYQTFPAETDQPLRFLNSRIRKNTTASFQPFLEHRRWELEEAARSILHQEFYFQLFAEDEEELLKLRNRLLNVRESYFKITAIPFEKKMKILFKLNNLNTAVLTEVPPMTFYPNEPPKKGYDSSFLHYIQPRGGFHPEHRYAIKGDGYDTCVHIVEYKRDARPFWGKNLFTRPNVITTQDTRTLPRDKVLTFINDSSAEQENRYEHAKNKTDQKMAAKEYWSLDHLADEVVDTQETVKELHTRLYVYAPTKVQLEEEVALVLGELTTHGFRGMIQLSEMEEDYIALFTNFKTQYQQIPRHGQEIKSRSLAGSYAFDFSFLIDHDGLYCGNTTSGGAMIFSHTYKDQDRLSNNMIICGMSGSGKSTSLKKLALSRVILGDQVFIFPVSTEFNRLCEALGGVSANIAKHATNILQVFATCVDEETLETQFEESFDAHMSKVTLIYRFLMDEKIPHLERELNTQLRHFYHYWCNQMNVPFKELTQLPSSSYPILEDFVHYLEGVLYEDTAKKEVRQQYDDEEASTLKTLLKNVRAIIQNDPLFNQHTQTNDFENAPIVVFNIETMLKNSAGKLNAQLFNCLNVFWDIMIRKGQEEKARHDKGEAKEGDYIFRHLILDEFHNWIRSAYPEQLDLLDRFSREDRKYFGALILASQHFHDMLPKASGKAAQERVDTAMNNIFESATYKLFMRQSATSVQEIRKWYGDEFSESELLQIPHLKKGHTIMNITGKQNIHFKWDLPQSEEILFSGGR
ncbi:VirB4 family type IV secretion system protein [Listeria goaensis]|uniref:VirB4 family type IV secretion system protein n=1 Tax=Listeria goaensis TaxID=1649188 RepID=UPI000B587901|nr:hypothetical protein [Listeria goaensis]